MLIYFKEIFVGGIGTVTRGAVRTVVPQVCFGTEVTVVQEVLCHRGFYDA